jgi:predicted dehydrogenase
MDQLRIGILGTARICVPALIEADRMMPEVQVTGVAAREKSRAELFSAQHGIPAAFGSYGEMLADPEINAVYIPLPNSLHAEWTLLAIAAGKHVLCEKPFTADAAEAERVAAAAADSGLVVMEAMHYRYHPLTALLQEYVAQIGPIRTMQCWTGFVIPDPSDIRYDYDLGGGALMDGGCYAIDCMRLLTGEEPEVTGAIADPADDELVDRSLAARLAFPGGATGWIDSSFTRDGEFVADLRVIGENGHLRLDNFILVHDGRLVVTRDGAVIADERPATDMTSWAYQLKAFAAAVLRGEPFSTDARNAAATMRVIDAAYQAAGLPLR